MKRHLLVGGDGLGATPCGSTEAPARHPSLALAGILAAAFVVAVTAAAMWVELGVLAAHAAAVKPSIQSCATMAPHVEAGR